MGKYDKKPKFAKAPLNSKTPRIEKTPEPIKVPKAPHFRGGPLVWRFSAADRNGPFSWTSLADGAMFKRVLEHMHSYETMTETEIREAGCHSVSTDQFSKDARDRLEAITHDDLDELFSIRITGRERVWCRTYNNVMHVLWWDPDHKVCPSVKKHT